MTNRISASSNAVGEARPSLSTLAPEPLAGGVSTNAAWPAVSPPPSRPLGKRLVEVSDLRVRYTKDSPFVLDGVNLQLHEGEMVALLGSSGSGKSTLMKSLTGFAPVTSGRVSVGEFNVGNIKQRELRHLRSEVGQVFQQFNLIGRLSVLTNVLLGSLYRAGTPNRLGTFRSADRRRAYELLDRVGIANKALEPARSLSGGQQQRVAIARALMQNPRFILADEPVASLDPRMSTTVLNLLQSIAREEGLAVLVSLHVLPLALQHSERIIGLRAGQVLVEGATVTLSDTDLAPIYADQNDPEEEA